MTIPDTLPKCLQAMCLKYSDKRTAMRKKDKGIWVPYTWKQSYNMVRSLCLGLMELGLEGGDKVCIIGDNDPQYFWAGGVAVGIFTDSNPAEIQYIVDHSDATYVFAKDQEQCDKLLQIQDQVEKVRRVIYWDDKGLWNYVDPWLISFTQVQSYGEKRDSLDPDCFDAWVAKGCAEDLAIFCYTSGTTGLPKGAMITHGNLMSGIDLYLEVDPRWDTDEYLSFLPPAWITENVLGLAGHLRTGMVVNFPEAPETVQQNIREIAPHTQLFSARLWESQVAMVQVKMTETTFLNRLLYRLFMPIGYKVASLRYEERRPVGILWRILYAIGDFAVFRPLRDKMGLTRIRSAYSSGAAQSPDVIRFFRTIGVNIKQLYGSTEAQTHTVHVGDDVKFESVGVAVPGMHVKIAEDGEILVRGPSLFQGYYKDEGATNEAVLIDEEHQRWFRTGDAGYIDEDAHLIYLDRLKEMIPLANGEQFPPQYIEVRLKFSPYIRDVMTIGGEDKPFVAALINIDFDNVGRWSERQGIAYTTFVDLSQKLEVYELIRKDIENVNRTLPVAARVMGFVLLHKEFDPDEAELTRTRKLRRSTLSERYEDMISALYGDQDEVLVKAAVKYRDGREGIIETTVHVERLNTEDILG